MPRFGSVLIGIDQQWALFEGVLIHIKILSSSTWPMMPMISCVYKALDGRGLKHLPLSFPLDIHVLCRKPQIKPSISEFTSTMPPKLCHNDLNVINALKTYLL